MPRPSGRPRKLDESHRRELLRHVLCGASLHRAALAVGCSARTVRREALRDGLFAWRLETARFARKELRRRLDDRHTEALSDAVYAELGRRLAWQIRSRWGGEIANPSGSTT